MERIILTDGGKYSDTGLKRIRSSADSRYFQDGKLSRGKKILNFSIAVVDGFGLDR